MANEKETRLKWISLKEIIDQLCIPSELALSSFSLELVKLTALMERNNGSPEVKIGLVDGPVLTHHADLASEYVGGYASLRYTMKYCAAVVALSDDKIQEQCWARLPAQSPAEARSTLCLCGVVLTPTYEADTPDAALHVLHVSEYWDVDLWRPLRPTTGPWSRELPV